MLTLEQDEAREMAIFLRSKGLNPVPSRPDEKRPFVPAYAEFWDKPFPEELFTPAGWPETANLQVICGRRWRLLAIDLDGPEAIERWKHMGRCPRTWVSHSGGGGQHVWFLLPEGIEEPIGKAFLWRGSGPHEAIERLCDRAMVVAPPSFHPRTGRRYRFLDDDHSPRGRGLWLPATAPAWVMNLRPIAADKPKPHFVPPPLKPRKPIQLDGERLDREEVLDMVHDKVSLAKSWGLRIAGSPRQSGWVPCHAFDRPDSKPSAAIHAASGTYTDRGTGASLSFYDLMVAMGRAHDWQDAMERIATRSF